MLLVHFGPFCLSLLMLNKQIFQSYWLFFAEQKYDFIPLHNSKLCRKTRVHNLTIIDNTLKLSLPLTAVYFSSGNYFKSENFWGGSSPPCPSPCYGPGLGTKSCRKRLWDCLGGRRSKQTRRNLIVRNVIAWIVVVTARF